MNRRTEAIIKYCKEVRPDMAGSMEGILTEESRLPQVVAVQVMTSLAFEAGRRFQSEHPTASMTNPNIYLPYMDDSTGFKDKQ